MRSITFAKMARSSSVEPTAASPGATGGSSGVGGLGAGGKRGSGAGDEIGLSVDRQQVLQLQPSELSSSQVKDSLRAAHDSLRHVQAHGSPAPWPAAAAGSWHRSMLRTTRIFR